MLLPILFTNKPCAERTKVLGGRGKAMIFSCSGYSFSPEDYQKEIKSLQGQVWKVQWSGKNQEVSSGLVHMFLVTHTVTCIWESSFAILLPCFGMVMFWHLWYFSYAWTGATWAALDKVVWCPFRDYSENPSYWQFLRGICRGFQRCSILIPG